MNPITAIACLAAPILLTGFTALNLNIGQARLRLILAFSAAYLFAISIMHMLPEVFVQNQSRQTGLFIVLGFCLQLIIETFSTGIEHGHAHTHSSACKKHLPYGIVIGLLLHSFLEGLPVYNYTGSGGSHVNHQLVLGLAIHNFPITLAFAGLLREHQVKKASALLIVTLFAFMAPLGYCTSYLFYSASLQNLETYGSMAYALVIGIFLHISTAILFESGEHHKYNIAKVLVMGLGIIMAYIFS